MNLAQASAGNLNGRGAGLLSLMFQNVPLLEVAEFSPDASTHFVIADKATHTNAAVRAVNAAISRDAQSPDPIARPLRLYGREITIDDVFRQDVRVGASPDGLKLLYERQLRSLAVKLAEELEVDMCSGDDNTGASLKMIGFSDFVKDAASGGQTTKFGFTTAELAAMNVQVGLDLGTEANWARFIEVVEKEMAKVPGANAIICNPNLKARLGTIAKKHGAAGETRTSFATPLATVNGVPVVPVSTASITQTETDGSDATLTSMYIVRFAEDLGVSFSTNSGLKFDDIELDSAKPNQIARLQMFLNMKVEKANAFRRLSRIKL